MFVVHFKPDRRQHSSKSLGTLFTVTKTLKRIAVVISTRPPPALVAHAAEVIQ
jgi:hypothetical protein